MDSNDASGIQISLGFGKPDILMALNCGSE